MHFGSPVYVEARWPQAPNQCDIMSGATNKNFWLRRVCTPRCQDPSTLHISHSPHTSLQINLAWWCMMAFPFSSVTWFWILGTITFSLYLTNKNSYVSTGNQKWQRILQFISCWDIFTQAFWSSKKWKKRKILHGTWPVASMSTVILCSAVPGYIVWLVPGWTEHERVTGNNFAGLLYICTAYICYSKIVKPGISWNH